MSMGEQPLFEAVQDGNDETKDMEGARAWRCWGDQLLALPSSCVLPCLARTHVAALAVGVVEIQDTASANKVDDKSLRGEYTVRGGTLSVLLAPRSKGRTAPFATGLYGLHTCARVINVYVCSCS